MPYNTQTSLWPNTSDHFFKDVIINPIHQDGPHCVSTSLAMLTGQAPEFFHGGINTQDPISWSEELKPFGMQLAYCPADIRRVGFYLDELLMHDDLFAICYYTVADPDILLGDPDASGWICGSHIVLMHKDHIFDPAQGRKISAWEHRCRLFHTKRIFRVVPANHERGL